METKHSIYCSAIKINSTKEVFSVPRPGRHSDVFKLMRNKKISRDNMIHSTQGFLLDDGTFVNRIYAKYIADEAGQLLEGASRSNMLFSEDVW